MAFVAAIPAWVYTAATAAAAVASAAASVQQGQTAKAAANYNVKIGQQNAEIAKQGAEALALQHDRETFLRLGLVKASQAKAGGTMEGSALDVLGDAAAQSELEKQFILYRGALGERQYTNTAALDKVYGDRASAAANTRAGTDLLSGAASSAANYNKLNRS